MVEEKNKSGRRKWSGLETILTTAQAELSLSWGWAKVDQKTVTYVCHQLSWKEWLQARMLIQKKKQSPSPNRCKTGIEWSDLDKCDIFTVTKC